MNLLARLLIGIAISPDCEYVLLNLHIQYIILQASQHSMPQCTEVFKHSEAYTNPTQNNIFYFFSKGDFEPGECDVLCAKKLHDIYIY